MTNIEPKLNKTELKEYFILLSNFFETLNYQLGESKSVEFKNIEFKFIPENCNNEFKLPIKLDNNVINSSDYTYAFKEHENKIYLVTLFGSFASSATGLNINDFTDFVAKKLETTFKKSSNFYYSSISLSGENEEIDLSNDLLNYSIAPEDSDILFEQFKNFSSNKEMRDFSINLVKLDDNSITQTVTISSTSTKSSNLLYNDLLISAYEAISTITKNGYSYFKQENSKSTATTEINQNSDHSEGYISDLSDKTQLERADSTEELINDSNPYLLGENCSGNQCEDPL